RSAPRSPGSAPASSADPARALAPAAPRPASAAPTRRPGERPPRDRRPAPRAATPSPGGGPDRGGGAQEAPTSRHHPPKSGARLGRVLRALLAQPGQQRRASGAERL